MTGMSSEPPLAVVVRDGDGEVIDGAAVRHQFKLTGEQSSGRLGFERFMVPPSTLGARPHLHHGHEETFYVLRGRLTVATGDGEVELDPGDLVHAPRGSVHGFRNASPTTAVLALCVYTPPGYEQYFRDVHAAVEAGHEVTPELLQSLRAKYRTESR